MLFKFSKLAIPTVIATMTIHSTTVNAAELVTKESPHPVDETMDRLVSAVESAGARVAARVDHSLAAGTVGIDLAPNQVLIFGNPKIGSPIFLENPAAGLDLPIRVSVFEDADGKTIVAYHPPSDLVEAYEIDEDLKSLKVMGGALDKLTNAAIAR